MFSPPLAVSPYVPWSELAAVLLQSRASEPREGVQGRACSPGAPTIVSFGGGEGAGCCLQRSLMPTTHPHRRPSLPPCPQPRPGLGFGGAQAPLLSLPLPEITPYEAVGLVGPGLPRDEWLPAYWTPRRAEGPSPPDVRPCLRGNPPRVSVPGQRGACPEWCSEFCTQGMTTCPRPQPFLVSV